MGKRVKKKSRSLQKEKRVSTHSHKAAPQQITSSVDTVDGGIVVSMPKERKQCVHLDKGFNLNNLSEKLGSLGPLKCEDCREGVSDRRGSKGKGKHGKKNTKSESKAIWVCLECAHLACGAVGLPTTPQSHALRHAKQTRHPLVIQWENPHLRWCFTCNTLIPVETTDENGEKKDALLEVVKLIKTRPPEKSSLDVEDVWFGGGSVASEIKAEGTRSSSTEERGGYTVRGLVNLGNTCFFNSVMQNLLAMDKLREFFFDQDASFGPLTIGLKKLFTETQQGTGAKNVINTRSFFGSICSKAPQFRGYQQQDSHELLRCLLDGLSSEELAGRKQVSASKETEISLKHGPTFVEALFGGQVSSTVSCIECGHSSTVYEPFLDLSLPVPTKKPPAKGAQAVSRSKKTKLPPKRAGRTRAKANRDADSVPLESSSNNLPGCQSPCQTQSTVPLPGNAVASSSDALGSESVINVANKSDPASQNFPAVPDTDNIAEGKVDQVAVSFDDFSWMDYLGEETLSEEQDSTLHDKDVPTSHFSENNKPNDGLMEGSQACSLNAKRNPKAESSINPWEEEVPLQVKTSEVLLLPYKEESFTDGDMMKVEAEASSVVGCGQDEAEFDGFGDLFNEPEVSSGPVAGPSLGNGNARTGLVAANSSESDPDEVDNSDSPVSVESCLAHFIKPELLSNDNAWECESCSKSLQCQRSEAKKKSKTAGKAMINGGDTHLQSHPPSLDEDSICSTEVGGLHARDVKKETFLKSSGTSWVSDNEKTHSSRKNCLNTKSGTDELTLIISQGEEQKDKMPAALLEQSLSSATYKSCDQESFSCPAVGTSSVDEPSSTGYETAKDQMGDSQFRGSCENCGAEKDEDKEDTSSKVKVKRDANKRVLVDKAPPILTIHLKRFSQDARGRLSKLNGHVNFGDVLDLRPYMDPRCGDRDKHVYRLLGVVEHLGTMRGGHYVAYVRGGERNKAEAENNGSVSVWYHASDAYVREVSLEEVLGCEAYILFYEKI